MALNKALKLIISITIAFMLFITTSEYKSDKELYQSYVNLQETNKELLWQYKHLDTSYNLLLQRTRNLEEMVIDNKNKQDQWNQSIDLTNANLSFVIEQKLKEFMEYTEDGE